MTASGKGNLVGIPPEGLVLLVDKPVGPTSFDVVAAVRRALGERRVGHTGTLDPLAEGLLPVCVGECTKLVPFLTDCDKQYEATIRLGRETASGDTDSPTVSESSDEAISAVTDAAIEAALVNLRGTIVQRPPAYSAIKVDGKPLYERVRNGEAVEAPLRTVTVHSLTVLGRDGDRLDVAVSCSKGTYVRSLAIDLGRALGVGGHVTRLRRTSVGAFQVTEAVTLSDIEARVPGLIERGLSPAAALRHLPAAVVSPGLERLIRQGKTPLVEWAPGLHAIFDADGALVAIAEVDAAAAGVAEPDGPRRLRVVRGFMAHPA